MKLFWKSLFWIVIVGLGLPVFGSLLGLILSSFIGVQGAGSPGREVLDETPVSTTPPDDLVNALSFFSGLTEVQKNEIKDSYRGKLVAWKLPVWDVSQRNEEFVIQTSSQGKIAIFCKIRPSDDNEAKRIRQLAAGHLITCKGIVNGYTLGNVNISPAKLAD
ncbi:hypothetical protein ACQZ5D_06805 [Agrobacterium sp. 22-211-1]|uniref:hypothetical protein n=1 Tax=Agrobacterium tomkonis TaxID=1183410 RepID=UPI001CD92FF8|nr:hypothetical protein [Agrobacterium tomkonis RTP8]